MKGYASAPVAVADRTNQPQRRQLRSKLASVDAVRSARRLALALRDEWRWRAITQSRYAQCFAARTDPWGYEIVSFELEKFRAAIQLLDDARNGAPFKRAWEIGCAEGVLTAQLAQVCDRLDAVDFIPLALERARARCQQFGNVSFTQWDLQSNAAPGKFELIVITDVLGSLGGRRDIREARDKVVNALAPGGYLLYGDCLGDLYRRRIEDSWWARLLVRGPRNIHRLVASHPALVEVGRRETAMHLLALFKHRG